MTKEQHLELLRFRLDRIEQKRTKMTEDLHGKSGNERTLTEILFKSKYGGIEDDIKAQIEWIEKNL